MRPHFTLLLLALAVTSASCSRDDAPSDDRDPPPSEEVSEEAAAPPPSTVGIVLPTPVDGVVVLPNSAIPVTLRNSFAQPMQARLLADVQANGAFNEVDLGTFDVEPGADREVLVATRVLGINLDTLETPAGVGFRVIVDDPAGEPLDGLALPTYYLHRDGDTVVLYNESVLIARYNGGDINGTFAIPGIPDPPPGSTKISAGAGNGEFDPETPPAIIAAGLQTICVHWKYKSLGHHAGEAYYKNAEPMAARGVKVAVQSSNGTQTFFAARSNGCLSAPVPAGQFQVIVHAHAVIGNGHDIVIRAFELEDAEQEEDVLPDSDERTWVIKAVAGAEVVHVYVPADDSSTMMAFGTFSVFALDERVPVGTVGPRFDLQLVPERPNSDALDNGVAIAPSQVGIKFVYGHEIGHWYALSSGFGLGAGYTFHTSDADCDSNQAPGLDHVLRSTEFNGAAFKEGMAHALSTLIWNGVGASNPRFRYYKDLDNYPAYDDLQADHYRVDMAARTSSEDTVGGIRAWRTTKCADATNYAQQSVELDWARFFVNLVDPANEDVAGDALTFADLIELLKDTEAKQKEIGGNQPINTDTYPIMESVVSAQFENRFKTLAEIYDVKNVE